MAFGFLMLADEFGDGGITLPGPRNYVALMTLATKNLQVLVVRADSLAAHSMAVLAVLVVLVVLVTSPRPERKTLLSTLVRLSR
jgi:hypothetical protein